MENARADANRAAYSQFRVHLDPARHDSVDAKGKASKIGALRSSSRSVLHFVVASFLIAGAFYLGWSIFYQLPRG
jgi:hypothetical protein